MATNLTETNNGIARQSNLVDEIIALKQHQRQTELFHREIFSFNQSNENINKHQSAVTDEFVSDLSRRLNNLSVTEKQEAQNDIYGFRLRRQNEDPLKLSIWMNEMDNLIQKVISENDKRFSALRLTLHTPAEGIISSNNNNRGVGTNLNGSGVEFIHSQKLKFLRSSKWNVEEAVTRLALFLALKLEHFGSECLDRDLTIKDLTPTDLELWKRHGFLQLSGERDCHGRAILAFLGKQQFHLPLGTVVSFFIALF